MKFFDWENKFKDENGRLPKSNEIFAAIANAEFLVDDEVMERYVFNSKSEEQDLEFKTGTDKEANIEAISLVEKIESIKSLLKPVEKLVDSTVNSAKIQEKTEKEPVSLLEKMESIKSLLKPVVSPVPVSEPKEKAASFDWTKKTEQLPEAPVAVPVKAEMTERVAEPVSEKIESENQPSAINSADEETKDKPEVVETAEKSKKNNVVAGVLILAAAIVAITAAVTINKGSAAKSIPVLEKSSLVFTGADGLGKAALSSSFVAEEKKILKKELTNKSAQEIERYIEQAKVSLDKTEALKNGDKVKVTVSTSDKKNPIKSETKNYTVSGLVKEKIYKAADLAKVSFDGINQKANLSYDSDKFTASKTNQLSNGDKIKLTLKDEAISKLQSEGQKLNGSKEVEMTVSGLTDKPKINNLEEILQKQDLAVHAQYQTTNSINYTIARETVYYLPVGDKFTVLVIYNIRAQYDGTSQSVDQVFSQADLTLTDGTADLSAAKGEMLEAYANKSTAELVVTKKNPDAVRLN